MERRSHRMPCRMRPLASILAAALALGGTAHATTRHVTNCRDDGSSGSLRSIVARSQDYDRVDLSALTCSTITLRSGAILIGTDYLTLYGSPQHPVTIDGNNASSLIVDTGDGMLWIDYLNFRRGFKYENGDDNALGGCIFSTGGVEIGYAQFSECTAQFVNTKTHHDAKGGAIYTEDVLVLTHSTISDSVAEVGSFDKPSVGHAAGGAVYGAGGVVLGTSAITHNYAIAHGPQAYAKFGAIGALQQFGMKYCTVSNNGVYADTDSLAIGGAIGASGDVGFTTSTVSNNHAGEIGGIYFFNGTTTATIAASTISGNTARRAFGGMLVRLPMTVYNSTIAFNEADGTGFEGGGGIVLANGAALDLESTIIADNVSRGRYDGNLDAFRGTIVSVTGAKNLVRSAGANVRLPADTLVSDPLLAQLANNGGSTETHALLPGSPAIDVGAAEGFTVDQRGRGFSRVVGAAADIGAYESGAGP